MKPIEFLGIAGSLREGSHNRQLLSTLALAMPEGFRLPIFSKLNGVPLFNEDLESDPPSAVRELWAAVAAADGLIVATPEYNQGISGVTKNLIDWLSRCPDDLLSGKPVAITGATVGRWGTRLAQQQLRATLLACGAQILPAYLFVASAGASRVTDADVAGFIRGLAECLTQN
jgi:chromate reductase, NAD(P)H dehydrogenase (quinone)